MSSGPVRFPWGLRLDRWSAERTPWEAAVAKPLPTRQSPTNPQARHRLHQQVAPVWREAPDVRKRPEPFQTQLALAVELGEEAIRPKVPGGVVVFDAWSLAEDVSQVLARRRQDWSRRLQKNRGLETASFQLRDVKGWALQLPGPHMAVEERLPLLPAPASRPVAIGAHT